MGCGIYIIKNIVDCKVYIGSSININTRFKRHKCMLKGGYHDNLHLQNAYNKYGYDNIQFEIAEECEINKLVDRENYYIELYKANKNNFGYNLATVNEFRRNIFNDEVKVKMSKTKLISNGNFLKFKLINIETKVEEVFDNLIDAANYFIINEYTTSKQNKIRDLLSNCLRGKIINNGKNGSIRKTIFKHKWEIIN